MSTNEIEQRLLELGNLWERGEMRRIYFDDLEALYGLQISRYNTGNISSARLDGESISNTEARRLVDRLPEKLWYDCNTSEFRHRGGEAHAADVIVSEIRRRVAEQQ